MVSSTRTPAGGGLWRGVFLIDEDDVDVVDVEMLCQRVPLRTEDLDELL